MGFNRAVIGSHICHPEILFQKFNLWIFSLQEVIMRASKIFHSLVIAGLLAFGNVAHAAVYDFGSLLTADYAAPDSFASNPFAQLQTTDNGGGVWTFMMTINNNLFSSFGSGAFLGSMSFDFTPDPIAQPVSTFIASNVGGVTSVSSTNGTGLSGLTDIDFGTQFGQNSHNRLSQNDWVSWSVSGLSNSNLTNMYVHVQGIGDDDQYSAKYTPTSPVPEPETYAMLLAGLGLIGFSARRRRDAVSE
jgi:PEP-CTERM motif